jgi:phospholipid-binding lipoprotein MlaA
LNLVNTRANLLTTVDVLSGAAIDKYSFIRNAYLQRRRFLITGGDGADTVPNYEDSLPKYDDGSAEPEGAAASAPAAPAVPASGASATVATPAPAGGPDGDGQTVPGQQYVPPPRGGMPGIHLPR